MKKRDVANIYSKTENGRHLPDKDKRISLLLALLLFLLLLAVSWNTDDAYHGFVMSRNLANGHGFVYNVGERVTASTCPLFDIALGLLYFFTRRMSITSVVFGALLSAGGFYICIRDMCHHTWQRLFALFACLSSQCYLMYADCGLENCMLFFFEAIYIDLVFVKKNYDFKHLLFIALSCSGILLTRMDAGILFVFPTAYLFLFRSSCSKRKMILAGVLGLLPFIAWELFSVLYYGFPFPNTFYAKENTGFPAADYLIRGIKYLILSLGYDMLLIVTVAVCVIALLRDRDVLGKVFSAGMIIKCVYLIRVGGDFMIGRHYTDLFWCSLLLLLILSNKYSGIRLFGRTAPVRDAMYVMLLCCTGLTILARPVLAIEMWPYSAVADERDFYFPNTGIYSRCIAFMRGETDPLLTLWNTDEVAAAKAEGGDGAMLSWAPGILVWNVGENFYMGDAHALGDPLLSHLPADYHPDWRIGHMARRVPAGYAESLRHGQNLIEDENLHEYYDKILLITRGDLWDSRRLQTILDMNLGKYDYLLEAYISNNETGKYGKDAA